MRATLRLKLHTDAHTQAALLETVQGFTACFNAAAEYGWKHNECNGVRIHQATYKALRQAHPFLPAQLVCASRMKAVESLKSTHALKQKGRNEQGVPLVRISRPQSTLCPVRYDARSYWVRLEDGCASLATTQGRLCVTFSLPDYYRRYLSWRRTCADLCYDRRKRRFYLHVVMAADAPTIHPSGQVVSCDLGVRRVAVTSQPQFFSSAPLHIRARKFQHLRSALQRKGTKSAKRHLRRLGRAWFRFTREQNHLIANAVLNPLSEGSALTVEDLTDIRQRCKHRKEQRGLFHRWSFAQLQAFLSYKAERRGIALLCIDPRNTSRTCPKCGHCEKANRKQQSVFRCLCCAYEANADYVAAQNLRQRGIASLLRLLSDSPSFRAEASASNQEQAPRR